MSKEHLHCRCMDMNCGKLHFATCTECNPDLTSKKSDMVEGHSCRQDWFDRTRRIKKFLDERDVLVTDLEASWLATFMELEIKQDRSDRFEECGCVCHNALYSKARCFHCAKAVDVAFQAGKSTAFEEIRKAIADAPDVSCKLHEAWPAVDRDLLLASLTSPRIATTALPCPHGREPMNGQHGYLHCPHCLGINS